MDNEQREEIKARILDAANRLRAERGQGGLDSSRRREAALLDGVRAIADWHGVPLQPLGHFNSLAEVTVTTVPPREGPRRSYPGWGVGFAADLGRVPYRQGDRPKQGLAPPPDTNGAWVYLGHFAAEALINFFAKDLETGRRPLIDAVYHLLTTIGGRVIGAATEVDGGGLAMTIHPGHNAVWDVKLDINVPAAVTDVDAYIAELHERINRAVEPARAAQRGPSIMG